MSDDVPLWQRKIDHRLRALWARTPEQNRSRESVRVLLRFIGSLEHLKEAGVRVTSVAGDIASATIILSDLPRIADASEVVFLELAQPLTQDQ